MSELKQISPMLDNLMIGDAISDHHGVRCYPAMREETDEKYIIKVISHPSSQAKLDALLITGVYPDEASAMRYFKELSDGIIEEVDILRQLSELEGFLPYESYQQEIAEDEKRLDVYLLGGYKRTLARQFSSAPLTHLGAINLGLDLCAALTVARRAGYLYVDLKPNNIYITTEGVYKIGDIGFLRLDGLKYASLPEMYHSAYTAPEVTDAFSALNDTLDVYAVGLILYQAYNGGQLPTQDENDAMQAPAYADYEMSEIILKAIAKDPADRWQTPVEIGQALVSYMQRNGANDTPIVPPAPVIDEPEEPAEVIEENDAPEDITEECAEVADTPQETEEQLSIEDLASNEDAAEVPATDEEDFENLSFLDDVFADEADLTEEDLSSVQLSDDLSEILEQADDLASHEVPEPVVAPEPIEIPIPEPILPVEETEEAPVDTEEDEEVVPVKKKSHWLRNSVIILAILALLTAGVFLFIQYYFVPIDNIRLEGSEDSLTVYVDTEIDESLLEVICSDPHGNRIPAPVKDGKAVFENLVPNTAYNVKVVINGFHKVTGDSSTAYSTPVQTNILQFSGVTGASAGTMILGFNIDGPDSDQWTITYSAEDEAEQTVTFPSHMITLEGFTVGKEYTFRLAPVGDLYVSGVQEIKVLASELIYAENLKVQSIEDGKLTATWTAPENTNVESWTVRCYNEEGYDKTLVVNETCATFEEVDETAAYTIEVIAAGMSVSQRAFVTENSTILTDVQVKEEGQSLLVSWNSNKAVPENGWVVTYSVDGHKIPTPIYCSENTTVIRTVVPGAKYSITVESASGGDVIGTPVTYETEKAEAFSCSYSGYDVTADNLEFMMCKTPPYPGWNRYYLAASDYTTTFYAGENASFLVHVDTSYGISYDEMSIVFVIRKDGIPVSISSTTDSWSNFWYLNYGELDIPAIPYEAGEYTIDIFFDGMLAGSETFTVI